MPSNVAISTAPLAKLSTSLLTSPATPHLLEKNPFFLSNTRWWISAGRNRSLARLPSSNHSVLIPSTVMLGAKAHRVKLCLQLLTQESGLCPIIIQQMVLGHVCWLQSLDNAGHVLRDRPLWLESRSGLVDALLQQPRTLWPSRGRQNPNLSLFLHSW